MSTANKEIAEAFEDLKAALAWGTLLEFTDEQRRELAPYCAKISKLVPLTELLAERKKRQAAEQRVLALTSPGLLRRLLAALR